MNTTNSPYEKALAEWKRNLHEALIINVIVGLMAGVFGAWMLTSYVPVDLTFMQSFVGIFPLLLFLLVPPVLTSTGPKPIPEDFLLEGQKD